MITAWFRREVQDDEWRTAMTEADTLGAAAEGAYIRMLLLTDDANLRQLADALSAHIDVLWSSDDMAQLKRREVEFASARETFIASARTTIATT